MDSSINGRAYPTAITIAAPRPRSVVGPHGAAAAAANAVTSGLVYCSRWSDVGARALSKRHVPTQLSDRTLLLFTSKPVFQLLFGTEGAPAVEHPVLQQVCTRLAFELPVVDVAVICV